MSYSVKCKPCEDRLRIMLESSLIEVLTADVEDFVSTLCLPASLKQFGFVKPPGEDKALSDASRVMTGTLKFGFIFHLEQ